MITVPAVVSGYEVFFEATAPGIHVFIAIGGTGQIRLVGQGPVGIGGAANQVPILLYLETGDKLEHNGATAFALYGVRLGDEL